MEHDLTLLEVAGTMVAHGEIDRWNRDLVVRTLCGRPGASVRLDLSGVRFLDCGGYGSLVEARLLLALEGRRLVLFGATAGPARLLRMIAELELRASLADDDVAPNTLLDDAGTEHFNRWSCTDASEGSGRRAPG